MISVPGVFLNSKESPYSFLTGTDLGSINTFYFFSSFLLPKSLFILF